MDVKNVRIIKSEYIAKNGKSKIIISFDDMEKFAGDILTTPLEVLTYVHGFTREGSDTRNKRRNIYDKNAEGVNLFELFNEKVPYCRERSVLAHILLAQIGIPSIIVSASSTNSRHTFVLYKKREEVFVLDGEKNVSKKLDAGKYYAPQKEYNQDIISQQLVEPVSLATDYKAIEANDTKYFESQSKCNLL